MNCRRSTLFALALSAAPSSRAVTPTLDDAALWLTTLGVRADLPRLSVRYSGSSDRVQGSDTTFRLEEGDGGVRELLQLPPTVGWDAGAFGAPQHADEKFLLLMLDPDAPERAGMVEVAVLLGPRPATTGSSGCIGRLEVALALGRRGPASQIPQGGRGIGATPYQSHRFRCV